MAEGPPRVKKLRLMEEKTNLEEGSYVCEKME
jgi:hypothetical protein